MSNNDKKVTTKQTSKKTVKKVISKNPVKKVAQKKPAVADTVKKMVLASEIDYAQQESLTSSLLTEDSINDCVCFYTFGEARPYDKYEDIINWVLDKFGYAITDNFSTLETVMNNGIVIDGKFLQYAKECDAKVKRLYKESVVSWPVQKSQESVEHYEEFFLNGVFLIETKEINFLVSALMQKGNQNEDETSFAVYLKPEDFDRYKEFRDGFKNWRTARDRSNLHIRVVSGEDIPYDTSSTWEDLFLDEKIKKDIRNVVEGFLQSKDFYVENKIPWKRGILLHGHPGNGKTSIIRTIMSQYNFKPVTFMPGANADEMREAFSYAEKQSPALLYIEDLDSIVNNMDISSFLNLLDGVSAKNGLLVIATANDLKKLHNNITRRPSRFDRRFEIPMPNKDMAFKYLTHWFGKTLDVAKLKSLAEQIESNKMSYAYAKELYVSSMFEAIASNRKTVTAKDVDAAIKKLIDEKNRIGENKISVTKYFNSP